MRSILALLFAALISSANAQQISGGAGGASGITIGSTVITGGTDTRILRNSSGTVGEYTLTGTGTVAVMQASPTFTGTVTTPQLSIAGSVSAAAWTTTGVALVQAATTFTDTSSSGTVTSMYVSRLGIPTVAASSSTTFTNSYGLWIEPPTNGTNVTMTNKYAAGFNGRASFPNATAAAPALTFADGQGIAGAASNGATNAILITASSGNEIAYFKTSEFNLTSNVIIRWSNQTNSFTGSTADTFLGRSAAATFQFGATNAASPVAQTLQSQGSRAGTDSNVGGGNLTITSGVGTGTGTLSTLTLQAPIAVASGTGAQTQTTGWRINNGTAASTGYTVATLPAAPLTGARAHVTDQLTTCAVVGAALTGGGAKVCPAFYDGTAWVGG